LSFLTKKSRLKDLFAYLEDNIKRKSLIREQYAAPLLGRGVITFLVNKNYIGYNKSRRL